MAAEDNESSGSRAMGSSTPAKNRQDINKVEVFNEVLVRLQQLDTEEKDHPDFEDQLWHHLNRFTPGYILDVNIERAEDVLMHMRLLRLAEDPAHRPSFNVRLVQVHPTYYGKLSDASRTDAVVRDDAQSQFVFPNRKGIHPPPTFGSSASPEEVEGVVHPRPMFEITLSTLDKPKVLTEMTSFLSDMGLNIHEAHAYSTIDGYSLDAFVLDGWPYEETEQLKAAVAKEILKQGNSMGNRPTRASSGKQILCEPSTDHVQIPYDGADVWEIDVSLLKYGERIGSGSFGDLYKGMYCSQEVAIKVLKPERVNKEMLREFAQEVFILRKIRHKNVVQFIGACTKSPNVCILTEFMSKGSLHSYLHERKGVFNLPALLKVALDVSKGMDYLHQNKIIHRDLKTGNLLMDENEVVKVSDFGVARVEAQSGVMTAETGTYRWMAPEVIEHKPYDHKADIFSFAVVLWELITGEIPHAGLTPLQAAVGVVQQGLRPTIPDHTHPKLATLLQRCWHQDPNLRPDFSEIVKILQQLMKEVAGGEQNGKSAIAIASTS